MFSLVIGKKYVAGVTYTETTEWLDTCYSNWIFKNDLTSTIISSESSSHNFHYVASRAIDGFYFWSTLNIFFAKPTDSNKWIRFDFGQVRQFWKIVIKIRGNSAVGTENLKIEISFSQEGPWKLFDYGQNDSEKGDILEFTGINEASMKGRFVRFTQSGDALCLAETVFIGI